MDKPIVVCLCGSTRFSEAFQKANLDETLAGRIVLTIGCDMKSDADIFAVKSEQELTEIKTRLDELHFRKIDLADEVLILNVDGYVGRSTRREWQYAMNTGKRVRWLEPKKALPNNINTVLGFVEPKPLSPAGFSMMPTLEELTAAYEVARHTWIQTTLSDIDIWHRAIAHQKAADALIAAQQARIAELERERDTAMRRTGHILNAARIVLEDIFEFPVNMQEVVYVQGYDGGLSRRRLALHGDTAGDVLRLKALIDELIAASPPADAPKEE